ncbi:MAG: hypothetical protein K0R38_521 [Polyangiaceae bacterium]|nr:hypothetical protein [Polyangiaceae bacterium]
MHLRIALQDQWLTRTDHASTLGGNTAWELDGNGAALKAQGYLDAHSLVFSVGSEAGVLNGIEAFGSNIAMRREVQRAVRAAVDQRIFGRLAAPSGARQEQQRAPRPPRSAVSHGLVLADPAEAHLLASH